MPTDLLELWLPKGTVIREPIGLNIRSSIDPDTIGTLDGETATSYKDWHRAQSSTLTPKSLSSVLSLIDNDTRDMLPTKQPQSSEKTAIQIPSHGTLVPTLFQTNKIPEQDRPDVQRRQSLLSPFTGHTIESKKRQDYVEIETRAEHADAKAKGLKVRYKDGVSKDALEASRENKRIGCQKMKLDLVKLAALRERGRDNR